MREQDWIAAQQLDSGAISTWGGHLAPRDGDVAVNPYFANFAALGLCAKRDRLDVVRRWMDWYFDHMNKPDGHGFTGTVSLFGALYPSYRFLVIVAGLAVAGGLYFLIHHTRVGMLIRAGASNPRMVSVLGVNIRLLNTLLFGLGAALAGLAGVMAAPILAVQPGMGDNMLIVLLVVIVIGGIGSIRGAFYGALIVGVVDTVGRIYLPLLLRQVAERSIADAAGPALASMLIFLFMAVVLAFRPQGLFPARK